MLDCLYVKTDINYGVTGQVLGSATQFVYAIKSVL